jgi:hypothetical protein
MHSQSQVSLSEVEHNSRGVHNQLTIAAAAMLLHFPALQPLLYRSSATV